MKSIIAIIGFAIAILTVQAEADQNLIVGGGVSGDKTGTVTFNGWVDSYISNASPIKISLKSGRRGTIRYSHGPSFLWPVQTVEDLNLNTDRLVDFICGGSIATNEGSFLISFDLQCTNSGQVLTFSNSAVVLPFGSLIASNSSVPSLFYPGAFWNTAASWSEFSNTVNVTTVALNGPLSRSGPLTEVGVGYLGVRFQAADGWHYGWIRVCLPPATTPGLIIISLRPSVLDWAYEKGPNTPIRAGWVSSARAAKAFSIAFQNPDGSQHSDEQAGHFSYGSAVLIGHTLRYQLHMAGALTNASIFSEPAGPRQRTIAPIALNAARVDLHLPCDGQAGLSPTNCQSKLTVFFGDVKLNERRLELLRRGKLRIDVGGGAAIGTFIKRGIEVERENLQGSLQGFQSVEPPVQLTTP